MEECPRTVSFQRSPLLEVFLSEVLLYIIFVTKIYLLFTSFFLLLGGYLVRCGDVETKVGLSERRFQSTIRTDVLTPLKAFLEVDLKNVIVSVNKELDFDITLCVCLIRKRGRH